jgi:hypothetical protein
MRTPRSYRSRVQAALFRARQQGGATAPVPMGHNAFFVRSASGNGGYTVRAFGIDAIRCECPAGIFDSPCHHAASVYLRLIADRSVRQAA